MPVSKTPLDLVEVIQKLSPMYGLVKGGPWGICLSRPDPNPANRFKSTGQPRRVTLGGVMPDQLQQILLDSDTPEQAAREIEAICTGTKVVVSQRSDGSVPFDSRAIAQVIGNQVDAQVAQRTQAMQDELTALRAAVAAMADPPKKKMGRPKGSKNKPKPKVTADGEPILSDEQEALLAKMTFQRPTPPEPVA